MPLYMYINAFLNFRLKRFHLQYMVINTLINMTGQSAKSKRLQNSQSFREHRYHTLLPPKPWDHCAEEAEIKSQRQWMTLGKHYLLTQQGSCTYEQTAVSTACAKNCPSQARLNFSVESGFRNTFPALVLKDIGNC